MEIIVHLGFLSNMAFACWGIIFAVFASAFWFYCCFCWFVELVSEPNDLVDCSAKVVHMAHRLGTSVQAQIYNPSVHLAGLPLFQEVAYFERTRDNPVYAVYSDP